MKLIEIDEFKPGFILKGFINHKDNGHFIIFIKPYHFPDFIGAMISTKNFGNKNILMSENHFKKFHDDGTNCKVIFNNSHLVPAKLHKFFDMGPFELCGILSENGLQFVLEHIENLETESWNQYLQKTNL